MVVLLYLLNLLLKFLCAGVHILHISQLRGQRRQRFGQVVRITLVFSGEVDHDTDTPLDPR